jgi:hypothetical protein
MQIKLWIYRMIQNFRKPQSYHDKWKYTYFRKEEMI